MFGFSLRRGLLGTPMAESYGTSFDEMNGTGMDVLGSLKKHSDFATRFTNNPTGAYNPPLMGFGGGSGPMNYGGF